MSEKKILRKKAQRACQILNDHRKNNNLTHDAVRQQLEDHAKKTNPNLVKSEENREAFYKHHESFKKVKYSGSTFTSDKTAPFLALVISFLADFEPECQHLDSLSKILKTHITKTENWINFPIKHFLIFMGCFIKIGCNNNKKIYLPETRRVITLEILNDQEFAPEGSTPIRIGVSQNGDSDTSAFTYSGYVTPVNAEKGRISAWDPINGWDIGGWLDLIEIDHSDKNSKQAIRLRLNLDVNPVDINMIYIGDRQLDNLESQSEDSTK